jgi:hypothetical protein
VPVPLACVQTQRFWPTKKVSPSRLGAMGGTGWGKSVSLESFLWGWFTKTQIVTRGGMPLAGRLALPMIGRLGKCRR